ncbi:DUF2057 family protein [Marinobacter oulmenensis]|uniref:Uncharacterized protein YccT (UPF0319 family) n=1 Tax=Marinobacter oulmenensis TaxID=643747 RepID=A0A840UB11_9GAMM|nr:DUF2057 family protein [Marinobacter oulmenensis]MBB5322182.1 uncharacterized protein YccT (UPF0319 family) [Marinobacter oulmenensis]
MSRVSVILRLALLVLASAYIAGCASSAAQLNAWDGNPQGSANPAVLEAPGSIQVKSINGMSMQTYLLEDLALDYGILPGDAEVIFTYKSIWANPRVTDNDESSVSVVETEPQVVRFNARAGATYRFEFDKPDNRREAERMKDDFAVTVVSSNGSEVASSSEWDGRSMFDQSATSTAGTAGGNRTVLPQGNTLEQLKGLWEQANQEEKRTFLRWAFE